MSKKCKKAAVGLSFSGALSATIQFLPEDGISDTSIPEYSRPLSKSDRLYVNLFRSIVGWRFRSKGPQKTDDYFGVKPPKKDPIINKKGRELGSRASIFRSIATQFS